MAGVGEREQHVVEDTETAIVAVSDELPHGFVDIVLGIERLDLIGLAFLLMRVLLVDLLIVHAHILFLNERRVREHKCTEVPRSRRTIDIAFESQLNDIRNETGMVNMRMRKDDAVQRLGIKTEVSVVCVRFHALTLIHTAIEQDGMARIGRDKMLTTRYFARCA